MEGSVTVKYRIERRQPRPKPTLVKDASQPPLPPKVRPDRTARLLALAHHIERLIDGGVLRDYSDAARRLGLTPARLSQLSNLLMLSPKLQEAILTKRIVIAERNLRAVVKETAWDEQARLVHR